MGTVIWKAAPADTGFLTAANYIGGVAPIDGDDVIINAGSGNIVGASHVTIELNSLTIGPNYKGNIGSSATKLQIDTAFFNYAAAKNSQTGWFSLENGGSAASVQCIITSTGATASPSTEGLHLVSQNTDKLTPIIMAGGVVTIANSTVMGTVHIFGGDLYIGTSVTSLTTINNNGARVLEVDSAVTTINNYAGNCEDKAGATGTINVSGGTVRRNSTGTLTKLNLWGGTYSVADAEEVFTTTDIDVFGGTLNLLARIPMVYTNARHVYNPAATILDDYTKATLVSKLTA